MGVGRVRTTAAWRTRIRWILAATALRLWWVKCQLVAFLVLVAWLRGYRVGMASPAALPDPPAGPPAAGLQAIRAWLTPVLAAEFDHEWELALEAAKRS